MDKITYEPFTAAFTGQMSVHYTNDGRRYTFLKPYPKIQKDQAYMFKVDHVSQRVVMLLVVTP